MYKRIYDSDEIVVDLDGQTLRISAFEDGHWVGEHFVEGLEPVVHAHWESAYEFDFGIGEERKTGYNCSRCGHYYIKKHDRCPDCGAHMDEIRRVGYCPICDKEVESYEEGSMTRCPTCNHDIVLHEEETT